MPGRNIIRNYNINTYYHVYNRGVDKRTIFIDDQDYIIFLSLLKRYLNKSIENDNRGRVYADLSSEVELLAFCLMPNHFHLLLYQIELGSITKLMRAVNSSYCTYFNNKYDRVGPLFQGIFRAVSIEGDDYLFYLSRYIHRNPSNYYEWKWSSLCYWLGDKSAFWLKSNRLNNMNSEQYLEYIGDDKIYNCYTRDISNIILENE